MLSSLASVIIHLYEIPPSGKVLEGAIFRFRKKNHPKIYSRYLITSFSVIIIHFAAPSPSFFYLSSLDCFARRCYTFKSCLRIWDFQYDKVTLSLLKFFFFRYLIKSYNTS